MFIYTREEFPAIYKDVLLRQQYVTKFWESLGMIWKDVYNIDLKTNRVVIYKAS